ncbi:ATP-dependent (S)-NAD(P)H-hydrate dehydratase isoform X2 [Cephus cinctus]|nr:ATP-dependent (S)-NAD(P)H-hydrate dehydratase isoform X2 [Cephus cinctus]
MSSSSTSSTSDEQMLQAVRKIIPELTNAKYKGQDGKIGIFGGSSEYTGAPYFAAMSALRTGADLVHIFCTKDAGVPIKSFSPEPIVHPILDQPNAIKNIKPWLERFHVVVIGPGLGRDEKVFDVIAELIGVCREAKKPAIIDADGLFLVCQRPDLIKDYPGLILTPNAMEFSRLMKACLEKTIEPASDPLVSDVKQVAEFLGKNIVVLHKAAKDVIVNGEKDTEAVACGAVGSGRRCGGQGDLLAGSLGVFWWWALAAGPTKCAVSPALLAAYAACRLIRESNAATFKIKQRGMLATDMLEQIQPVFHRLYETHAK